MNGTRNMGITNQVGSIKGQQLGKLTHFFQQVEEEIGKRGYCFCLIHKEDTIKFFLNRGFNVNKLAKESGPYWSYKVSKRGE